jgi:hypothetical protein
MIWAAMNNTICPRPLEAFDKLDTIETVDEDTELEGMDDDDGQDD